MEGEGCYMQDHLGCKKGLREELRQWELVRCDRGNVDCNGHSSKARR